MPRQALSAVAVLLLAVACVRPADPAAVPVPADPGVVQTSAGALRGVGEPGHRFFGGIPYAAPPVGPLRFRPPQAAPAWDGVRDAARPGPRCLQAPGPDPEFGTGSGEDCLSLNVWTPARAEQPKPVLVWFHGGSFINGDGGMFDAHRLVERGDIVVVTLNYRLGALGFLAHPALGPPGDVGNYGLADQQAALRWVRDNIAAFGGDSDRVTVAGESAGAMSVCDHLAAPGSRGLFDGAIIMSGPCRAQAALPHAQRVSLDYAAAAGCADIAAAAGCLRDAPVDALREPVLYARLGVEELTGPVTATTALPVDPLTAAADGTMARVPVLIGTTRDEFTLFTGLRYLRTGQRITAAAYPQALAEVFGTDAAAVAQRYPANRYREPELAYSAALTDSEFACVADRLAADLDRHGSVYAYEFADQGAPAPEPLTTLPFPVGASHSLDVRYVFDVGGAPELTAAQQELSRQMIDYWAAFARTGAPAPDWPRRGSGQVMTLHPDGSKVVDDYARAHQCAFWD